jgi:hypothetical protein
VPLIPSLDAVTAAASRLLGWSARKRHVQVTPGRAVIEVHGLDRPGTESIADEVERALARQNLP